MAKPVQIISPDSNSTVSKIFQVRSGYAMVVSSFNFKGVATDEYGEVTREGDCAVLHKLKIEHGQMPHSNGCTDNTCHTCTFEATDLKVVGSEPVMVCNETLTHHCGQNLTVLAVPGFYMFELCNAQSLGEVAIEVEEISAETAHLIPQNFFHGA
nr:MAG TPA: hypothetical protein [Caudoviricetes sp.]